MNEEPVVPGVILRVPNGHVVSVAASELAARELARSRGYDDTKLEMGGTKLVLLAHALGLSKPKTKTNEVHSDRTLQAVSVS